MLLPRFQAEDVRCIADNELGFQQVTLSQPAQAKTYLFINTERMVVGCLVAENIRQVTPPFASLRSPFHFFTWQKPTRAARSEEVEEEEHDFKRV